MRICVLTTGFPRFAGDLFGAFVLELVRELAAQGVEPVVVAPHAGGLPRCERVEGVKVKRFGYLWPASWQRVAYGGGIPTNLKRSRLARLQVPCFLLGFWWRALRESRGCELIHCHWTICGLVGRLATRRPLVLSVRGSDIHLMEKGWMGRLNRRIYRWMDAIIAISEEIAAKLAAAGVEPSKIRVIGNGVDRRFQPLDQQEARRQLDLPEAGFIALFVGLLVPIKGPQVLLRAAQCLGEGAWQCALVGDGPLRGELEAQARQGGMAQRILFAGQRPTGEIPAWMNAADVLVLPSFSEGRPNVVLEAQACGTPVIATRVGGTPELIRHGENGLLVDSGDAEQLAGAIAGLMQDPPRRRALGRAGRAAVAGLTWEVSARQVRQLYQELLGGHQG